jgi:hypothetical protein
MDNISDISTMGFSDLKPAEPEYVANKIIRHNCKLKAAFEQSVINAGPYYFFTTLTFSRSLSMTAIHTFVSDYLYYHNQYIFSHKYKKLGRYMSGYAVIENHKSSKLQGRLHVHLLIKANKRYLDFTRGQHLDMFEKAASKVETSSGNLVFMPQHIKLELVYSDGCVSYSFKNINDRNIDRIKLIGIDGLSDSC